MNGNLSSSYSHNTTHGWVPQGDSRGTLDILWSCTITIFLCCWTSVCVNIPAAKDSSTKRFRDKFDLACLGLLGPEFLFTLALGQWISANRSVEIFHARGYSSWTMTHAFFADMGGFVLQTPGWKPFPLDAEQLYYMVSQGYLEYPKIEKATIDDKDKADGTARYVAAILMLARMTILSASTRFITVVQVLWFSINCIGRVIQRIALTTLELTTLAFILSMLATSICWRHKPLDVSYPIVLETDITITEVLKRAGPAAQHPYRRTPLDFVSRNEWYISRLWAHYIRVLRKMHIGLFSRPITVRPIDRIPGDNWTEVKSTGHCILAGLIYIAYAAIFLCGWNLPFPTRIERILWRVTSICNMAFLWLMSALGGWYQRGFLSLQRLHDLSGEKAQKSTTTRKSNSIISWMRNNSPDQDPAMEMSLRFFIPATALCSLYCLSRMYILIEDFIGLRELPFSAFDTVNWSHVLPHF